MLIALYSIFIGYTRDLSIVLDTSKRDKKKQSVETDRARSGLYTAAVVVANAARRLLLHLSLLEQELAYLGIGSHARRVLGAQAYQVFLLERNRDYYEKNGAPV